MAIIRVLVVEDEGPIRLMIAEVLRDAGFEVVEAWNGEEATSLIEHIDRFDVLLTGVRMPGKLDGIDVAVYARNRDPTISVVIVSGYASHFVGRLKVLGPPVVLINKPYMPEMIVQTVRCLTATL